MLDDGIQRMPKIRYCEKCGRPNVGADRCPHAINPKLDCPKDKQARARLADRLRRMGR